MSTAFGIALILIGLLAVGVFSLWTADHKRRLREILREEWKTAADRLGLEAHISTDTDPPTLSASTPEGRLEVSVARYRSKLALVSGTPATI